MAAIVACSALAPAPAAALPSETRPASPTASRLGSTMPTLSGCPLVIRCSRAPQVSGVLGQPRVAATGSGMASTTGLRAIDGACGGTRFGPAARTRTSQLDESGTQTSGTTGAAAGCADGPGEGLTVSPVSVT